MNKEFENKWQNMSIQEQISNIGSEVNRALEWKNSGNLARSEAFVTKAIQLLSLSIKDPKNKHRIMELTFCIEELQDYFFGNNFYNTTEAMFHKYYDAFL